MASGKKKVFVEFYIRLATRILSNELFLDQWAAQMQIECFMQVVVWIKILPLGKLCKCEPFPAFSRKVKIFFTCHGD